MPETPRRLLTPPADGGDVGETNGDLRNGPTPSWSALLLLAVAYAACGVLTAHWSVPPLRLTAPVFPAAGIALAGVLVYGRRALLPVGLGSLLLQLSFIEPRGLGPMAGFAVGLTLATGAAAQAALGAWLVRRAHRGAALLLDDPRSILKTYALGAALACVVGATCAVLAMSLGAAQPMPPRSAWMLWGAWWASDALGVVIGLPVALTVIGRPRRAWAPRWRTVAMPLLLALLLVMLGVVQIGRWYDERVRALFERDAVSLSRGAEQGLRSQLDALEGLYGVYLASNNVTAAEFKRVSALWLSRFGNVRAMGWHERVDRADLPAFQTAVHAAGETGFQFIDRDPSITVGDTEALVLRFVEPTGSRALPVGTNLLSLPAARQPLIDAMRSLQPQATGLVLQTESNQTQIATVAHRSVRAPDGRVRGVLFVSLLMEKTLEAMRVGAPDYLQACLVDTQAEGAARALAGPASCQGEAFDGPFTHTVLLPFAGRLWALRVAAPSAEQVAAANVQVGDNVPSWLFAQSALLATGMLGMMLLIITGRTRRTEQAIAERTAQLEAEIAERERNQRGRTVAEAANRAKTQFLSRMSHELRTPLNAVLGFAQLLESDRAAAGDERQRQWAGHIQEAGWHLLALINDVLDLSRIEAGTVALASEPVLLEPLVTQSMALIDAEARARGISVAMHPSGLPALRALGDPTRLKQVLVNLLSNAVKYNRDQGRVTVSLHVKRDRDGRAMAVIAVRDTGPGLEPAQVAQLFQPFNRLGREHSGIEGMGIGLAIASQLVERQGGVIQVDSTPGEGTTFAVCLPMEPTGAD